ncbi:MAG: mannose-6-phosphate isomerase, class I [Candidatus Nanopelagicales bacterium]
MHRIRGSVKEYPWGVVDGLAPWLGDQAGRFAGRPQAELWFGVHPSGPSPLVDASATLADELTRDQAPILAKILAAAQPLSVQVHPDAHDALRMWKHQQIAGPQILADPHEKAEVLLALEPFDAFVGWRPTADAAQIVERVDGLALAAAALHDHDHRTAIQMIVERRSDAGAFAQQIPGAVRRTQEAGTLSRSLTADEIAAYDQAARDFPDDIGVALTPLLDFVTLAPGDAVYLAPGIPHSYVRGIGFEVMTSSDNVLRLGLTGKPVFIDHALPILDFSTPAQLMRGSASITPEGGAFSLVVIDRDTDLPSGTYRLVVAIEGTCQVRVGEVASTAAQGEAVAITGEEGVARVTTSGRAIAAIAS